MQNRRGFISRCFCALAWPSLPNMIDKDALEEAIERYLDRLERGGPFDPSESHGGLVMLCGPSAVRFDRPIPLVAESVNGTVIYRAQFGMF